MRSLQRSPIPISVAIILLAGCSGTPPGQHAFREYLDDGMPVAENSNGPRFEGDLFSYEELVTLHQDPGEPESLVYHMARPSFPWDEKGFFVDAEDRYFVRDRGNYRIAVFDQSGHYLRGIGRGGQGPGELSGAFDLIDLSEGVLGVYDGSTLRTSYYSTDGAFLRSVQGNGWYLPDQEAFARIAESGEYDVEGNLWLGTGFRATTVSGDSIGSARTEQVLHKYSFPTPGSGKGGRSRPDLPFSSRPVARLVKDGSVLLSTGIEPVLWWYWLDGSLRKVIVLGFPIRPVTGSEREAYLHDLDLRIAEAEGEARDYLSRMRPAVLFPEFRTFCSYLFVDDRGFIWLEGHEEGFEREAQGGGVLYYLLSPEGEYLGTTRAPAAGRVMRERLLATVTDQETGEEHFIVWRLEPRVDGFRYR